MSLEKLLIELKARGNFGHAGRPGKHGGSAPRGGGGSSVPSTSGEQEVGPQFDRVKFTIAAAMDLEDGGDTNSAAKLYSNAVETANASGVNIKKAMDEARAGQKRAYQNTLSQFDVESGGTGKLSVFDPKFKRIISETERAKYLKKGYLKTNGREFELTEAGRTLINE